MTAPEPLSSVVFLHLSKTAGQSVHTFLERLFGPTAVAPARVNVELTRLSIADIRAHRVLSGHLDWSMLDCVRSPKFVFTILREPLERILSFYFFLRRDGSRLTREELDSPANAGIAAALRLPCDEYFAGEAAGLRNFLDNLFDNFYTFYFAGRMYNGRGRILERQKHDASMTDTRILDMARANLATLDAVYRVDELPRLEHDLRAFALATGSTPESLSALPRLAETRVNVGDRRSAAERLARLKQIGATDKTFGRLQEMTRFDTLIWQDYGGT